MNLTTQGLQISADLPLLVGDRVDIECNLDATNRIHCALTLTHAAGRHAGGHLVDITPEHHRRLMAFLDQQNALVHNGNEPR